MWEGEQSFLWFVNIFFFYMLKKPWLYMKDGLNLNNQKRKKYTAARIIHKYMLHVTAKTLFLYKAHLITSNINPFHVLKIYVEQKLLHFLNDSPSPPSCVCCGKSLWRPVSPKDTPPPQQKKGGFKWNFISICVTTCFSSLCRML